MPAKTAVCSGLACLMALASAAVCQAEVYKWVDAAGQTHYSERKADANGAKAAELRIRPSPKPAVSTAPSPDYWREQNSSAPNTDATAQPSNAFGRPGMATPPPSLSNGIEHGTDESRCALARDVLSGAVRHGNGKPIDRYDRDVAQNDIKAFCRKR